MISLKDFNELEEAEQIAYLYSLPLADQYLLDMRLVWDTEPWKDSPGGWSWEVVMQGYENIRQMEAVRE